MKGNRIQVILPNSEIERFVNAAKKEGHTESSLARKLVIEGLKRLEEKERQPK